MVHILCNFTMIFAPLFQFHSFYTFWYLNIYINILYEYLYTVFLKILGFYLTEGIGRLTNKQTNHQALISRILLHSPQITSTQMAICTFPAKVSLQREDSPYICGLGARFECERVKRTFKPPRLKSQI